MSFREAARARRRAQFWLVAFVAMLIVAAVAFARCGDKTLCDVDRTMHGCPSPTPTATR